MMPFLFASGLCLSALLSLSLCSRGHQDGLRCAAPCWQADRLLSRQALGRRCFSIRRLSMPPLASVANQHVRSSSIQSKHVLPRLHSNPIIGRELLNATRHLSLHEKKKEKPQTAHETGAGFKEPDTIQQTLSTQCQQAFAPPLRHENSAVNHSQSLRPAAQIKSPAGRTKQNRCKNHSLHTTTC
jgi:hypothetical protein